jgi:hypothetical protein
MGAPHTLELMKMFPDVPRFQDFRQMFDKMGNQIDAVSAGVPDFSHFPIAMLAMSLGKHVYVEKPMALNHRQCLDMIRVSQENGMPLFVRRMERERILTDDVIAAHRLPVTKDQMEGICKGSPKDAMCCKRGEWFLVMKGKP